MRSTDTFWAHFGLMGPPSAVHILTPFPYTVLPINMVGFYSKGSLPFLPTILRFYLYPTSQRGEKGRPRTFLPWWLSFLPWGELNGKLSRLQPRNMSPHTEFWLLSFQVYNLLPVKNLKGYYYQGRNVEDPDVLNCVPYKKIVVDGITYSPDPYPSATGDSYKVLQVSSQGCLNWPRSEKINAKGDWMRRAISWLWSLEKLRN